MTLYLFLLADVNSVPIITNLNVYDVNAVAVDETSEGTPCLLICFDLFSLKNIF